MRVKASVIVAARLGLGRGLGLRPASSRLAHRVRELALSRLRVVHSLVGLPLGKSELGLHVMDHLDDLRVH